MQSKSREKYLEIRAQEKGKFKGRESIEKSDRSKELNQSQYNFQPRNSQ